MLLSFFTIGEYMYVVQLPKLRELLGPHDYMDKKEAIMRADTIQELVRILDKFMCEPYLDANQIERFFTIDSPFFNYQLPPSGDYIANEIIIDMTTLEQRLEEILASTEVQVRKDWQAILDNTVSVKDYLLNNKR